MSDYRIGLVVEGITDRIVIESALNKIFADHTYTLIQLQPELSDGLNKGGFGSTGSGWGGVYQWCRQMVNMDIALQDNLFLQQFDIHSFRCRCGREKLSTSQYSQSSQICHAYNRVLQQVIRYKRLNRLS
jgi:hypothetical protein